MLGRTEEAEAKRPTEKDAYDKLKKVSKAKISKIIGGVQNGQ